VRHVRSVWWKVGVCLQWCNVCHVLPLAVPCVVISPTAASLTTNTPHSFVAGLAVSLDTHLASLSLAARAGGAELDVELIVFTDNVDVKVQLLTASSLSHLHLSHRHVAHYGWPGTRWV
jgi:hypothetical protein